MNRDFMEQFDEYWRGKNKTPLVSVTAPGKGADFGKMPARPVYRNRREQWTDTDYLLKQNRFIMENTYYGGVSFPNFVPNYGPDIMGAICGCGCNIEFGEDTSWAVHSVEDWATLPDIKFDPNNEWFAGILEMTRCAVKDSGGEYVVGITDLHPGSDALASLRGPEELCFDTLECPGLFKKFAAQIHDVYEEVYSRLYQAVKPLGTGSTYWMQIWGRDRHYVVGADFSCLVSADTYEDLVVGSIEKEVAFLDKSVYHLDGPDALRHLDRLLKIDKLTAVQWVPGAGSPTPRHWLDVYRKIQAAGKRVVISLIDKNDIKIVCENLDPAGLFMTLSVDSEEEARTIEKLVASYKK